MKKIILSIFTIIVILFFVQKANAQPFYYDNAIGVCLGESNGVTYKYFSGENKAAIEAILSYSKPNNDSIWRLTGLYEFYHNIDVSVTTPGLLWYYGIGASIGSRKTASDRYLFGSIDGVIGVDYKIEKLPINLSLDWKSAVEFLPTTKFDIGGVNLSVRYTF